MTKTRPQRERTSWDWKPLIVIPMMVYLNAVPKEVMPNQPGHPSDYATQGAAHPHNADVAPVQGVTGDGKAFVCPPNPKWPVLEFCWMLTDERR